MKPQKLTAKKVKDAAIKAYKERRLTAQHRNSERRECVYSQGEYHCAIGWALNEKTLQRIDKLELNDGAAVDCLVSYGVIAVDEDDLDIIEDIQGTHDEWADASKNWGAKSEAAIECRDDFLAAIGLKQE